MARRPIAVCDAETDPFAVGVFPQPFIWGYYNGKEYHEFSCWDYDAPTLELVKFLSTRREVVYAHNGGKFDFHFLLDHLEPFSDITVIAGRLAKFKIGECEFRDSYNIIPVPLSAMEKDEFDYSILEKGKRDKPANRKKIKKYLHNDCLYLFKYVMAFIDRFGVNLTIAGTTMKQWQKVCDIKAPKSTPEYYDLFYNYYYGGRVQCFETGIINTDFEVVDINSAYPYAMLHEHPIGLTYQRYKGSNKYVTDSKGIIPQGFYTVEAKSFGAFPIRGHAGALDFPNSSTSNRVFHVTGWELIAALETETCKDVRIREFYIHDSFTDFREYILPLYEERKEAKKNGDKETTLFNKLLMNSLYGKFAANPSKYKSFTIIDKEFAGIFSLTRSEMKKLDFGEYEFGGELGPWALAQRELDEEEKRFYNVATAASITGFVRAYLWRAIHASEGVLYCDTDSIAARKVKGVEYGDQLGAWESEGEFIRAAIGGKKMYAFFPAHEGGKVKTASKGVRLSAEQLEAVAAGTIIEYTSPVPVYSVRNEPKMLSRKVKKSA